ncbi:MAG: porin family protein, partial [Methylobacteriaceae bacterium]|nr:porin family protein [Methylobacteriaceae bacterium]
MGSLKSYVLLAGILAGATTTTARAADLLPPPPLPDAPLIEDFGGGWYLRGDVGVGLLQTRGTLAVDASVPPVPYVAGQDYFKLQDRLSDQVFVGAGIGYQVNSWLRFDATGEYRTKADWSFVAVDLPVCVGCPVGGNLTTGQFSSAVFLANAYFDLGHWYGITPFIGGGVGVASHKFTSVLDTGVGTSTGGLAGVQGGLGLGRAREKTNLAYALYAGLGYDVSSNLKLELAYRYLNMGDVESGSVGCLPDCGLRTIYKVRDLESHDIKL